MEGKTLRLLLYMCMPFKFRNLIVRLLLYLEKILKQIHLGLNKILPLQATGK